MWDLTAGEAKATLTAHGHTVRCVTFSPGGRTLASGSFDKTVRLWDMPSGRPVAVLKKHRGGVRTLGYPVSSEFPLLGKRVQLFQRQMLALETDGSVMPASILDQDVLPITRIDGLNLPPVDPDVVAAMRQTLADSDRDPAFAAEALMLPGETTLAEEMAVVDVAAIHAVRESVRAVSGEKNSFSTSRPVPRATSATFDGSTPTRTRPGSA